MITCGTFLILQRNILIFLTKSVDDHLDGYRVPLIIKLFRFIQSIIKQLHEEEEE